MPTIFELFGYPLTDRSEEAEANRQNAYCPFRGMECDGGGNRYQTFPKLSDKRHVELQGYFTNLTVAPVGVCSIQMRPGERPWIVCPRRLLFLGRGPSQAQLYQQASLSKLLPHCGFFPNSQIGIWPEITMQYSEVPNGIKRSFNSKFDYVLMALQRVTSEQAETLAGIPWSKLKPRLVKAGYSISMYDGQEAVDEFPVRHPIVIEIMTSSTTGGGMTDAFKNAVLARTHVAPAINSRQVWARMASQLIVKSEVALAWGGKTLWLLQDVLIDYITATTGLNIYDFETSTTDEVNIIGLSYNDSFASVSGILALEKSRLYSGPISASGKGNGPSFQDLTRAAVIPPKTKLIQALASRSPSSTFLFA